MCCCINNHTMNLQSDITKAGLLWLWQAQHSHSLTHLPTVITFSLIYSVSCPLGQLFTQSVTRSFTYLLGRLPIFLLVTYWLVFAEAYPLANLFSQSPTHLQWLLRNLFTCSLICLVTYSLTVVTQKLIHLLSYMLSHLLTAIVSLNHSQALTGSFSLLS